MANPEKSYLAFPFSIKKMASAGCLFDFDKLNDVSKNVLARMTAEEIYDATLSWAKKYSSRLRFETFGRSGLREAFLCHRSRREKAKEGFRHICGGREILLLLLRRQLRFGG